jgi:hypothetical protein
MTESMALYVEMWVRCLHALTPPRLPSRCRFFRDMGGETSLTCVVVGPERGDGEPEVIGLMMRRGAMYGPEEVMPEARQELLAHFD